MCIGAMHFYIAKFKILVKTDIDELRMGMDE